MKFSEHIQISRRALKLMFRLEKTFTLSLIFSALLGAITPYIPVYFSAKLIDALFSGSDINALILYAALTVGLTFALMLAGKLVSAVRSVSENNMYNAERWMYSEKAMDMEYSSIEDSEVKLLLERIKKETQTGFNRFYVHRCIEDYVANIAKIIASISLCAELFLLKSIPAYMKLILLAGIGATALVSALSTKRITRITQQAYDECVDANVFSDKYSEYIHEYGAGKDTRLYGMSDYLSSVMADNDKRLYELFLKADIKKAIISLPDTFLNNALKYATYMILILAALNGAVSVGSIAKYVSCVMLLLGAISALVKTLELSSANHTYLKRYFSYFDIPNNMYKGSLTIPKRDDNEYYIEFRNVSFRYPNTEAYALRNVSIRFKVGEKLAVVGMNGSGKTTFIKLMCRLYDPTEGEILLNGVDIRKYDYDEYMSVFSVVFQDFRLFAYTLGQNVAARVDYDEGRVWDCLRRAGFEKRAEALPGGLGTYLYKHFSGDGVEISGGEAQKIALARALYKDAPFIILDEPTAALDPVSEYEIYSSFNSIVGDKTVIYISHRLASCRFCDKIAVFDNGNIVQSGAHDELVRVAHGKYHELWHAQAQYYTSDARNESENSISARACLT